MKSRQYGGGGPSYWNTWLGSGKIELHKDPYHRQTVCYNIRHVLITPPTVFPQWGCRSMSPVTTTTTTSTTTEQQSPCRRWQSSRNNSSTKTSDVHCECIPPVWIPIDVTNPSLLQHQTCAEIPPAWTLADV